MPHPITSMVPGVRLVIIRLEGGDRFRSRMGAIGIREQKTIRIVAKHPFHGPLVIEVDGRQITLGCGMAQHIIAEVLE